MQNFLTPIHKEGYLFIGAFALIAIFLFFIWPPLGWIGLGLTIWCGFFFRDPERVVPTQEGAWVAGADGVVCAMTKMALPEEIRRDDQAEYHRVSIFMNVFNCHINRSPYEGRVEYIDYVRGSFFNASWDKASLENERQYLTLRNHRQERFVVTQIAGLVARRIVCWTSMGRSLACGERFGMIRFGSRVDIYLPGHVKPIVQVGQIMVGGETIIAYSLDAKREGQEEREEREEREGAGD